MRNRGLRAFKVVERSSVVVATAIAEETRIDDSANLKPCVVDSSPRQRVVAARGSIQRSEDAALGDIRH